MYFLPSSCDHPTSFCAVLKKIRRDKNLIKASLKDMQQKSVDNAVVL